MGWLNLESNEQAIEMTYRSRECEEARVEPQCINEIKGLLDSPDDFLNYDEKKYISYIRLSHNSLFETKDMILNSPQKLYSGWRRYCSNPDKLQKLQENYNILVDYKKDLSNNHNNLTLSWILYYNNKGKDNRRRFSFLLVFILIIIIILTLESNIIITDMFDRS